MTKSNRFESYEDLEDFRRTRWHINRQINTLYQEMKKYPDISDIENVDFRNENNTNYIVEKLHSSFQLIPELTNNEANTYAYRLREVVVSMKSYVLHRDTFSNPDIIREVLNKTFWKMKAQKIEAVEAILFYLRRVGCEYSLAPYEKLLEEVKARKKHAPKEAAVKNI